MELVLLFYVTKRGMLNRVQVVRLCTFFILPALVLALSTNPLYGQETHTILNEDGVIKEYLPLEEMEAALEGIAETIELRGDLEDIKYVLGAGDEIKDGYKIVMNEDDLPEQIERPDGTAVLFSYPDNENGEIKIRWGNTEITYTGDKVIIELKGNNSKDSGAPSNSTSIIYGDDSGQPIVYDGLSFIIVIPREDDDGDDETTGGIPLDRDRLIRFGMADWEELEDAFEDLLRFKRKYNINLDLQVEDSGEGPGYSLGEEAVGGISYKQRLKQKKDRLNKAVSNLTEDLGFSSYRIKGDLFEGILATPEKEDN